MHKEISLSPGTDYSGTNANFTGLLTGSFTIKASFGSATVVDRISDDDRSVWIKGMEHLPNDSRYFDLSHASLQGQFQHLYLVLKDHSKKTRAIQPFLFVQQDIMAGLPSSFMKWVNAFRVRFPNALKLPMLMIGCSAGEGHLSRDTVTAAADWVAHALRESMEPIAKKLGAWMIVLKDFPRSYRNNLDQLRAHGFERIPSMPGAKLALDFPSFEEYLTKKLSHKTRKNLRQKYRQAEAKEKITMEVMSDITPIIDKLYPLYRQVLNRSKLKFEELTPSYFCDLGRTMPERSLFLVWKIKDQYVAFCTCLAHEGVLRDNYIGMDYQVAFDHHLYYVTWRDTVNWALKNKFHTYYSAPLNYEPKYHLRMELAPLDLYVRMRWSLINPMCRLACRYLLEPTKSDHSIRRFANSHELW